MRNQKLYVVALLTIALAVFAGACKKKQAETLPEPTPMPAATPAPTPRPVQVEEPRVPKEPPVERPVDLTADQINRSGVLKTVYFDFDKSDLRAEARATLRDNAEWLKNNARWSVVIEGHCDERGTIEYNLELGQRRARAVRDYLSSLGIAPSRMRSVSYGEERPVDPGHTETAWAKNRRAEFKVE